MSQQYQDRKVLVIHGKNPIRAAPQQLHNPDSVQRFAAGKNPGSSHIDATVVERRVDEGDLRNPRITGDIINMIVKARNEKGLNTQKKLATFCCVPEADIKKLENRQDLMLLTQENVRLVRKVQAKLGMPAFELPKLK